jgi:succinate dehydrogenase / fumarate reductase cytochrome b subunit
VLAASGLVMLAYVLAHMAGNLLAFAGAATFDAYARWLRDVGAGLPLLLVRVLLAVALASHLAAHAWMLFHPAPVRDEPVDAPVMPAYVVNSGVIPLGTGALIAIFVAIHLAQLTFGLTLSSFDASTPYRNLIAAQSSWPVALGYVVGAMAVGAHLLPGAWSGMRTLGWITRRTEGVARTLSPVIAVVIAAGLSSVPLAIALEVLS